MITWDKIYRQNHNNQLNIPLNNYHNRYINSSKTTFKSAWTDIISPSVFISQQRCCLVYVNYVKIGSTFHCKKNNEIHKMSIQFIFLNCMSLHETGHNIHSYEINAWAKIETSFSFKLALTVAIITHKCRFLNHYFKFRKG